MSEQGLTIYDFRSNVDFMTSVFQLSFINQKSLIFVRKSFVLHNNKK